MARKRFFMVVLACMTFNAIGFVEAQSQASSHTVDERQFFHYCPSNATALCVDSKGNFALCETAAQVCVCSIHCEAESLDVHAHLFNGGKTQLSKQKTDFMIVDMLSVDVVHPIHMSQRLSLCMYGTFTSALYVNCYTRPLTAYH